MVFNLRYSYSECTMCGRYARKSAQELLAEWFEMDLEQMRWAPTWNAAPQSFQPVVRLSRDGGEREASLLRWGLVSHWAKDARIELNTINARAEEAADKPVYREALKKRRCLVPADAFYEWQRTGAKNRRPFAIALRSGEPCAFAGLWESWQPPEGAPLETFTILTTAANARKRLRRAVLTRVGDGCDCGRLCPQILKWTRPVRKMGIHPSNPILPLAIDLC